MTRLLRVFAVLIAAVSISACVAYPYGYPAASVPANFERSWDAALGAAADAGVQVTSADRASGRIAGNKAGANVVIALQPRADGSLQVSFDAPNSKETNPTLQQRWLQSYERRMGR